MMIDLNDLIDPELGLTLNGATSINDAGQIAAYGRYTGRFPNSVRSVLLTLVPEPAASSMGLTVLTVILMGRQIGRGTNLFNRLNSVSMP